MTIFGKHLWHSWEKWTEYHDCSDICFWSSGFVEYRRCRECGRVESRKTTKNLEGEYVFDFEECKYGDKIRKPN